MAKIVEHMPWRRNPALYVEVAQPFDSDAAKLFLHSFKRLGQYTIRGYSQTATYRSGPDPRKPDRIRYSWGWYTSFNWMELRDGSTAGGVIGATRSILLIKDMRLRFDFTDKDTALLFKLRFG